MFVDIDQTIEDIVDLGPILPLEKWEAEAYATNESFSSFKKLGDSYLVASRRKVWNFV